MGEPKKEMSHTPGPYRIGYKDGSGKECIVAGKGKKAQAILVAYGATGCGCCSSEMTEKDEANLHFVMESIEKAAERDRLKEINRKLLKSAEGIDAVIESLLLEHGEFAKGITDWGLVNDGLTALAKAIDKGKESEKEKA